MKAKMCLSQSGHSSKWWADIDVIICKVWWGEGGNTKGVGCREERRAVKEDELKGCGRKTSGGKELAPLEKREE